MDVSTGSWSLQQFEESLGIENWKRSFLALKEVSPSGKRTTELWTSGWLQFISNGCSSDWKEAIDEFEEWESSLESPSTDSQEQDDEEEHVLASISDQVQSLHQEITPDGMTLFEALNSNCPEREASVKRDLDAISESIKDQFASLYLRFAHAQRNVPSDVQKSPTFKPQWKLYRKNVHSWFRGICSQNPSALKWKIEQLKAGRASSEDRHEVVKSFLLDLMPEWCEIYIRVLEDGGILEVEEKVSRQVGAFAIPGVNSSLPYICVGRPAVWESTMGYVHEVGHAIHFAASWNFEEGWNLPNDASLEVFPVLLELLFCMWAAEKSGGKPIEAVIHRILRMFTASGQSLKFRQMVAKDDYTESEERNTFSHRLDTHWQLSFEGILNLFPRDLHSEVSRSRPEFASYWFLQRSVWTSTADCNLYASSVSLAFLLLESWLQEGSHGIEVLNRVDAEIRKPSSQCAMDRLAEELRVK